MKKIYIFQTTITADMKRVGVALTEDGIALAQETIGYYPDNESTLWKNIRDSAELFLEEDNPHANSFTYEFIYFEDLGCHEGAAVAMEKYNAKRKDMCGGCGGCDSNKTNCGS